MSEQGFAAQLAEDLSQEDLRMVLRVFGDDVRRLTEVLDVAAREGDSVAFRRAAHGLAGAAGAVGAVRLEQACRAAMAGERTLETAQVSIAEQGEAALRELGQFLARIAVVGSVGSIR